MGTSNFQNSWKKDRPSLVPVKKKGFEVMCRVCGGNLNVTNATGVIKAHEKESSIEIT